MFFALLISSIYCATDTTVNTTESSQFPKVIPTRTPIPEEPDDPDITKLPEATEEVIYANILKNIEINSVTYVGFALIGVILLLFIGWKFCYSTASNAVDIPDDMEINLNNQDPDNDNIRVEVDDFEDNSDKQEP